MTGKVKSKPLQSEVRLEYCVAGCNDGQPTEHRRRLCPGFWIVRCQGCLHSRKINTMLGLCNDFGHIEMVSGKPKTPRREYERRGHVGAAMLTDRLFVLMKGQGLEPQPGDIFTANWLGGMLDLRRGLGITPHAVAKRMIARGYIEATDERQVYRWVNLW